MKLAIIIPVYETPKRLNAMLACLTKDNYRDKEIIVAIDGDTNERIEKAIEPYRRQLTIHYNQSHLGKVDTLNRLGKNSRAEVLLFFDNDVCLSDDPTYLEKLMKHMENVDIAEIPKEAIVSSFVSSMVSFEFIGFAIATWMFSRLTHHCPSMNGAAFAVKQKLFERLKGFRKVVNEDMDFAARAFRKKARFGYDKQLKIKNEVPVGIHDWLRQRRRWALNNLNWLKDHFLYFLSHMLKTPRLIIPLLLLFIPFILIGAAFIIMRNIQLTALLPFIFMIAQYLHGFAGIFLWITHYHLIINDGLFPSIIALVISGLFHYGFARYFNFKFNFIKFILFYFIYSPIWIVVNLVIWIRVAFRIDIKMNWKV